MKQKVLNKIGYRIEGLVNINFWGGGEGEGEMYPIEIYHPEMSYEELLKIVPQGINDAGFGVESFNYALCNIYDLYEHGVTEHICEEDFENKDSKFRCGFFDEGINAKLITGGW